MNVSQNLILHVTLKRQSSGSHIFMDYRKQQVNSVLDALDRKLTAVEVKTLEWGAEEMGSKCQILNLIFIVLNQFKTFRTKSNELASSFDGRFSGVTSVADQGIENLMKIESNGRKLLDQIATSEMGIQFSKLCIALNPSQNPNSSQSRLKEAYEAQIAKVCQFRTLQYFFFIDFCIRHMNMKIAEQIPKERKKNSGV